MKIIAPKEKFTEAFNMVQSVVPARSTRPVLMNIKVSVENGEVVLLGTNAEVSIRYFFEAERVEGSGSLLLPADRICQILNVIQDGDVTLTVEGEEVEVNSGTDYFKVNGETPEEFPDIDDYNPKEAIELKVDDFKFLIKRTKFATAKEQTRYALNGVYMRITPEIVECVGTDGRRLARANKKVDGIKVKEELTAIIPTKATEFMEKLFVDMEGKVQFYIDENQICVKTPKAELISRLVEGHYPKYMDVIPKDLDKTAKMKKGAMNDGLRKALIMTSEETKSVRFVFDKGALKLESRSPEKGESTTNIEAEYDGEEVAVNFNPRFVMEVLKVIDSDEIIFEFKDAERAGNIIEGEEFQYVVMPIRPRD